MSNKLSKRTSGFTIVEVLIVLAIAGIIMLVVFLAVPALQRNSRNSQRRADASHLMALINEFQSNNNGQSPTSFCNTSGCGSSTALELTNENFSIMSKPTASAAAYSAPAVALDTMNVYRNTRCNNNAPSAGGGDRSVAVVFYVEPANALQCVGT